MNRHERRKAKVLRQEQRTAAEISKRAMCIWGDCRNRFEYPMPEGWRYLMVYWAPQPVRDVALIPADTWDRDAVLCPEHARTLDAMLKDIGRWADRSPAGSG